ncbi:hypothetical protein ACQ86N_39410 [Puia sp. P3]|uniref:hypothetical protein n=1 Tax=Puia sp. P3 TaxID=3423952 RepID=UPI003D67FFEE
MKVLYTARAKFGKSSDSDTMAWEKYLEWSRLPQLIELISVDGMLNERLIEPDRDDEKEWDYIVIDNMYETGFFTTLDYVLKKIVEKEKYNLLAVIINPDTDCRFIEIENFEFIGYDLLDKYYDISALSNCGGFDETFRPEELNQFGLVEDFNRAMEIKGNLFVKQP